MPANILNLPDYKVVRVEETEHDYATLGILRETPNTTCAANTLT